MSTSKFEQAKAILLKNPGKSLLALKKTSGISARTFDRASAAINGTSADKATTSFQQKGNNAEYSFKTGNNIRSLEDLVKACDIDLSNWVVERWVCNKWEVGAKDSNDKIQVTPLFQVKVWLKPHNVEQNSMLELIRDIVAGKHSGQKKEIKQTPLKTKNALNIILSDLHVGLDPYLEGKSIFNYIYNEQIFNANLDKAYGSIIKEFTTHGKFDVLIIDDLGDGLDGWNAQTTRGGHSLDQNMSNTESFKAFVLGKLRFIEKLINAGVANRIEVRSVSNCNHSGSFGYIANYTIGLILGRSYSEKSVKCTLLEKFIEHFEYGDHTFIITHGKDAKYMFKGFPLDLNDKTTKFINDYIDHYNIRSKYIHVLKGDLHRVAYQRTKKFDYRNFMSFAPPSVWQQHNFGDAYSGYSIQVIPFNSNEVSHTDYFFELETSK